MTKLDRIILTATADATGIGTAVSIPQRGRILRISLKYDSGIGASTQVAVYGASVDSDVADQGSEGYLFVTGETDAVYYPRSLTTDESGQMSTVVYEADKDVHDPFTIFNLLHLKIMNATEDKSVSAEILVESN